MKKVLVPIDFSNASKNAAIYAINLAKDVSDVYIYFYHSYKFADVEAISTSVDEDAAHAMYLFIQELLLINPDLNFEHILNNQLLIEGISSIVATHNIDLVIMGARGKSSLAQKLIGSNTITVAQEINTPVLIVPEKANYFGLSGLLVSLQFSRSIQKSFPINQIIKIKNDWNLNVHFATVEEDASAADMLKIFENQENIINHIQEFKDNYVVLDGKDVATAMFEYANNENISWLCTVVEEKGFWERLIKGSVTATLSSISNKPILVFNKN